MSADEPAPAAAPAPKAASVPAAAVAPASVDAPVNVAERSRAALVATFAVSTVVQLLMVVLGVFFVSAEDDISAMLLLLGWCLLGTGYAVATLIVLGLVSRRTRSAAARPTRIELGRAARIVSFTATFFASIVGVVAAFQVLTLRSDPTYGGLVAAIGVWAMLLAWGFLHWGFAQIYQQEYFSREVPPMRFPSTPHPGVIEFVYFSFTLGTSFAASDVEVQSTRVRWRVIWHSVLSFFFNGLIVVLALNTILSFGGR